MSGPAIDLNDVSNNQEKMFGVHTFNVQQFQADSDAHVKISIPENAVDTSVNKSFVDSAPNLPFKLFGLEKLFHHGKPT